MTAKLTVMPDGDGLLVTAREDQFATTVRLGRAEVEHHAAALAKWLTPPVEPDPQPEPVSPSPDVFDSPIEQWVAEGEARAVAEWIAHEGFLPAEGATL